jgi:hypothetical protein
MQFNSFAARCAAAAATAALANAPEAAKADVSSSAVIDNLQIRTVDLDPADGVVPSFSFTNATSQSAADLHLDDGGLRFERDRQPGWLVDTHKRFTVDSFSSKAATSSRGLSASGTLTGTPFTFYESQADTRALWTNLPGQGLNIAPNTKLTVTVDYTISGAIDRTCSPEALVCETAVAQAYMGWLDARNLQNDQATDTLHLDGKDGVIGAFGRSGSFTATLTNDTSHWISDELRLLVSANGFIAAGPAAPVPEPSTLALLALGLSAVGARARRRAG